jgi:hypothetical protein
MQPSIKSAFSRKSFGCSFPLVLAVSGGGWGSGIHDDGTFSQYQQSELLYATSSLNVRQKNKTGNLRATTVRSRYISSGAVD